MHIMYIAFAVNVDICPAGSTYFKYRHRTLSRMRIQHACPHIHVALFPGLLTPAFVACSTNVGDAYFITAGTEQLDA